MLVSETGRVIEVKMLQPRMPLPPMVVTCVPDKSIEVRLVQLEKAKSPMVSTELGKSIEVKLVHSLKACEPIPVTGYPSTVEGIVIAPLNSTPEVVAWPGDVHDVILGVAVESVFFDFADVMQKFVSSSLVAACDATEKS